MGLFKRKQSEPNPAVGADSIGPDDLDVADPVIAPQDEIARIRTQLAETDPAPSPALEPKGLSATASGPSEIIRAISAGEAALRDLRSQVLQLGVSDGRDQFEQLDALKAELAQARTLISQGEAERDAAAAKAAAEVAELHNTLRETQARLQTQAEPAQLDPAMVADLEAQNTRIAKLTEERVALAKIVETLRSERDGIEAELATAKQDASAAQKTALTARDRLTSLLAEVKAQQGKATTIRKEAAAKTRALARDCDELRAALANARKDADIARFEADEAIQKAEAQAAARSAQAEAAVVSAEILDRDDEITRLKQALAEADAETQAATDDAYKIREAMIELRAQNKALRAGDAVAPAPPSVAQTATAQSGVVAQPVMQTAAPVTTTAQPPVQAAAHVSVQQPPLAMPSSASSGVPATPSTAPAEFDDSAIASIISDYTR